MVGASLVRFSDTEQQHALDQDQIVCLLPRGYCIDAASLPKCLRVPRGAMVTESGAYHLRVQLGCPQPRSAGRLNCPDNPAPHRGRWDGGCTELPSLRLCVMLLYTSVYILFNS
jgi:hypothetical protein